jgi:membrane protein
MSRWEARVRNFARGVQTIFDALFFERNALAAGSSMAFSLFLASVPLMGLTGVVIARVLRDEPDALSFFSRALEMAPNEVRDIVDHSISFGRGQAAAPMFLASSIYVAAGAFHDGMTTFETAVSARPRSWWKKRLIAIGCVLALILFFILLGGTLILVAGGPLELFVTLVERGTRAAPWLAVPFIAGAVLSVLVAAFFRVAVTHDAHPRIWPGAFATVGIGLPASMVFALYARSLARYTAFYGSLAAVAVFLVWLWLCCVALLVGVEVNAYLGRSKRAASSAP